MSRKIHAIYDVILKLIAIEYGNEFLAYIGEKRKIKRFLKTEFTTKKGRKLYLDFLCVLEDNTLLNIEFQFTGPDKDDLERFYGYNTISEIENDAHCETLIINSRTSKSGQKSRKIGKSKSIHPESIYLGDIDFEKKLNIIEDKALNNIKLTTSDEISMMLISILPKYKNKTELLERIINISKKEELLDKEKLNTFKAVLGIEIENFANKNKQKKLLGDLNMTPESEKIINKALSEVSKKHLQIEADQLIKKGREEGKIEGKIEGKQEEKREVAKKLKGILTPEEISKITGLTLTTIISL